MIPADPDPPQGAALCHIVSGAACYGTDTGIPAAKRTAEQFFHTHIEFGGEFDLTWREEPDGTWSLFAVDDDADPDEDGLYPWWSTGVRLQVGPHPDLCPAGTSHRHEREGQSGGLRDG